VSPSLLFISPLFFVPEDSIFSWQILPHAHDHRPQTEQQSLFSARIEAKSKTTGESK
jgi:hypothetical protein